MVAVAVMDSVLASASTAIVSMSGVVGFAVLLVGRRAAMAATVAVAAAVAPGAALLRSIEVELAARRSRAHTLANCAVALHWEGL